MRKLLVVLFAVVGLAATAFAGPAWADKSGTNCGKNSSFFTTFSADNSANNNTTTHSCNK